ncbi:MAG: hypothetical protein JWQ30_1361, partial [Sediminibacterium sp.]|nr:hypothetical protein [Sediminibacterium sp.]
LPACQKDDPTAQPVIDPVITPVSATINGTWELRSTYLSWVGLANYAPGNGTRFIFNNGEYEFFDKGQFVRKGIYTIQGDTTVVQNVCLVIKPGAYPNRIIYDSGFTKSKSFFELKDGQLSFISGCYAVDAGHSETYALIK